MVPAFLRTAGNALTPCARKVESVIMKNDTYSLTIVIPAYNEEKAIAAIIERCMAERERIIAQTPVQEVEVLVVNDGSRDRTPQIAQGYPEVRLISYTRNQGYGAALKRGFDEAHCNLVSFLDADGTCDPHFFIPLVNRLIEENADVALGSRLGPESEMPAVRRLGNRIYTFLINTLTSARITDSASGMRVIRRASLEKLYPLPDGLHFTPAMTARAVSSEELGLIEVPISYKERVGQSKLSVVGDGVRFLKVIMDIILSYRPLRFFFYVAAVALALALGLLIRPGVHYLTYRQVPNWMIYRLVGVSVLMLTSLAIMTVGLVADQVAELVNAEVRRRKRRRFETFLRRALSQGTMIVAGPVCVLIGLALNWRVFRQFFAGGHVTVPWVFPVTGSFFVLMGVWSWGLGMLQRIVRTLTIREQQRASHLDSKQGTGIE